jgi:hypothetical protein
MCAVDGADGASGWGGPFGWQKGKIKYCGWFLLTGAADICGEIQLSDRLRLRRGV